MHLKEVEKTGTRIEIENSGHNILDFDHFESEILSELKTVKYRDLEDMVYRLQITYDQIVDIMDVKYTAGSSIRYTLSSGVYEITDINSMLKSLLPGNVKLNITVDDIRLKSKLTTNKTIRFTEKSFFCSISCFIQSHSGDLDDIPGFVQVIPGSYKSDKPSKI